jgi:hypothetical protein
MLVDSNSQRGSVVLRGIEIDLDSDIGCGFIVDCCRFCEGLLAEDKIKSKYGLTDTDWTRLAENEPLVRAVETEKARRVRDGTAAREKAQWLFVQAPDVLGNILNDTTTSPRHRIEAARELRQVATGGAESTPATGDRFIIRIDLTAGGGEVVEFDKALAIEPGSNKEAQEGDEPFDKGQQQSGDEKQSGGGNPFIPAELRALPEAIERQRMSGDSISQWSQWCIDADVIRRPAGPYGSTESDNLGTRVANEHLRDSYIAFCTQQGVRPVDPSTFGKACTHMFGRKQRLVPKEWNERRPPAYDVPTAEAWQERLDAMREATPREGPVHRGVGVGIFAGRVKR